MVKLAYPTDDSRIIAAKAQQSVRSLFQPGYKYLKSGIGLIELIPKKYQQQDIFHVSKKENSDALMTTLDSINQRYGQESVFFAAEGIKKCWPMCQQYRSPCYTTD